MQTPFKNPFNYFDAIYLINLDSRPDRLNQAMNELRKQLIKKVIRIPGIVHQNPATGCHLSHAECYLDAINSGYDRILIMEDDIEFFPNAYQNLEMALIELPADWDMFYLGANLDNYKAYEISEHVCKLTGAYATHAYAVKRPLFQELFEINSNMSIAHNDVYYAENIHPNYNCYMAMPLIAGQRDSYSDIQKCMMSSNKVFLERLERNIVR